MEFFPNSYSDYIDIRAKRIELMKNSELDIGVVINSDAMRTIQYGPALDCFFSFDNKAKIHGVFTRSEIRFFTPLLDDIDKSIVDNLIKFIGLTTPQTITHRINITEKLKSHFEKT